MGVIARGQITIASVSDGSSVRLDLTNEFDMLPYDAAGNCLSAAGVSTNALLYDGAEIVEPDELSYAVGTGIATVGMSSNKFTVTALGSDEATIQIWATYKETDYVAVFSVRKLVGQDKYELVLSDNAVRVASDGTVTPSTITAQVWHTAQGGTRSNVSSKLATHGLRLTVDALATSGATSTVVDRSNDSSNAISFTPQSCQKYTATLTNADKTATYDVETIPVVADGKDGVSSPVVSLPSVVYVPCTSAGIPSESAFEDTIWGRMYVGGTEATITAVAITNEDGADLWEGHVYCDNDFADGFGITVEYTDSAGLQDVGEGVLGHAFTAKVTGTVGGTSYTGYASFTVVAQKAGEKGDSTAGDSADFYTMEVYDDKESATAQVYATGSDTGDATAYKVVVDLDYKITHHVGSAAAGYNPSSVATGETLTLTASLIGGSTLAITPTAASYHFTVQKTVTGLSSATDYTHVKVNAKLTRSGTTVFDLTRIVPLVMKANVLTATTSEMWQAVAANEASVAALTVKAGEISSTVTTLDSDMDGLADSVSEVRQTAESISLKVKGGTTDEKRWNMLDSSYMNMAFYNGVSILREVELIVGKTYTLTARGKVLKSGCTLRVCLVEDDDAAQFTPIALTSTASTTGSTTLTLPATDDYSDGETVVYYLGVWVADSSGSTSAGSGYGAVLEWLVLEQGAVSSGEYLLSANDKLATANMLAGVKNGVTGAGGDAYLQLTNAALASDTVTLSGEDGKEFAYYTCTPSAAGVVLLSASSMFTLAAKTVYMLSFWAKKGGRSSTTLRVGFPAGTSRAGIMGMCGSNGKTGLGTGYVDLTLSTSWARYWVTFYNTSSYSDAGFSLIAQTSGVAVSVAALKLHEGGRLDSWTDYGQSAANSEAEKLLATGVDIENRKITLTADNTEFVDNGGETMGVFTDGGLQAGSVRTFAGTSGQYVDISEGMITFMGSNSSLIQIGCDANGDPVMKFYLSDGSLAWKLDKDGLDATDIQGSSWYEMQVVDLAAAGLTGTYLDGETITSETEAAVLFKKGYAKNLVTIYRYTAASTNGVVAKDTTYGFTTADAASAANGKWFTSKYYGNEATKTYMEVRQSFPSSISSTSGSTTTYSRQVMPMALGKCTKATVKCSAELYKKVNG